ncbi:MAG: HAD family phosphatase [Verrucomicrobiota bacterium]
MTKAIDPNTAFLFDVGNVILFFDFKHFGRAIEAQTDYSAEQLKAMIDEPKDELEASLNQTEAFLKLAFEMTNFRGTREEFVKAWVEIFDLNEPISNWIEELSDAGHPLYLLSNTNELHVEHFMNAYSVFKRFDGAVFSNEVGMAKPDPAIFAHTIEKFDLNPAETIYIDDLGPNAEAGAKAGLRSVQYSGQLPYEILEIASRTYSST